MRSDEPQPDSNLTPDWFAGFDDQVSEDEKRRRRMHVENVKTGEYLVITDPRNQMIGTPLKVLGVAGPLILCLDEVHEDSLHCIDVRRHTFVYASREYVDNHHKYARAKYNQAKAMAQAKQGKLPGVFVLTERQPQNPPRPPPEDGPGVAGEKA